MPGPAPLVADAGLRYGAPAVYESWEAFYRSQAQGLWALLVLPAAFLAWLAVRGRAGAAGVEPRAAGFVHAWALFFAAGAIVDLVATGPLGWPLLPFVLLGDYRVLALVLVVAEPARPRGAALLEAAAWTLVVPAAAYAVFAALVAVRGPLPDMALWLVYEAAFALLAAAVLARVVPRRTRDPAVRAYLRAVLGLVILYYVLWAAADVVILAGDDRGWALRAVPNQLYYGAFVPAAWWLFLAARSAVASASTHASR